MTPIAATIIDDEPDAGQLLKNLLNDFSAVQVKHVFTDAFKALDVVIMEQTPLIFLDVEMPEITGIEFIKQLHKFSPGTKVVFVTAFKSYALEAIQNSAFDFITKPVAKEDLRRVVYKIAAASQTNIEPKTIENNSRLLLKTTEGHHYVSTDDIVLLEADGNYTSLMLKDEKRLLSSINLGRIFEQIPNEQFIRISRKHIINKKYLTFMNFCKKYCLVANNGNEYRLEVSVKMKDLREELK